MPEAKAIPLFERDSQGHAMFVITMLIADRMTDEQFYSHWDSWSDDTRRFFNDQAAQMTGAGVQE
jgi:hypothetical protein